jgi:hypothetical protein
VWVGSLADPVISGPVSPRCNYTYTYRVDDASQSVGQSFYWESDILNLSNETSAVCTAEPYVDGEGYISCTVTACGVSRTSSAYVLAKLCSEYHIELSPNPTSDMVEIVLIKNISTQQAVAKENSLQGRITSEESHLKKLP